MGSGRVRVVAVASTFNWRRLSEVCTGFYHQTEEKVLVIIGISAGAGA